MTDHTDRRHFARVAFTGDVTLTQAQQQWQGEVVDISLKGALIRLPKGCKLQTSAPIQLRLALADDTVIEMTTQLSHLEADMAGLACQQIDVESVAHLRRLVELNTGDPVAAEREVHKLGQPL
ncbi:PilZ domain-containing protein [Simiduia sp. 21SJ11W-1]|uniref:PilZ domain-containing protein n=1 Tax=Simiduia sp. 21SJ11W-1 TaxID=2909669 RepID=UPI00209FB49E|nr:PilZ domain-containing protein [Simiduia sp. 21SJ11W-1]UTA48494.1 PilZ domain-containing protein [Simiduia sp. 21SJ11W-1]